MTGRANRDIQTPEGTVEALISALHADDHARASYLERALRIWIEEAGAELSDDDRKRIASAMAGRTERARRASRASSTRASSSSGDARIVLVDGDPETRGTLAQFFADNAEGIDEGERDEIRASLETTGRYDGGGGAGAEYTIELAAAPFTQTMRDGAILLAKRFGDGAINAQTFGSLEAAENRADELPQAWDARAVQRSSGYFIQIGPRGRPAEEEHPEEIMLRREQPRRRR